jgi:hypothetical protein
VQNRCDVLQVFAQTHACGAQQCSHPRGLRGRLSTKSRLSQRAEWTGGGIWS